MVSHRLRFGAMGLALLTSLGCPSDDNDETASTTDGSTTGSETETTTGSESDTESTTDDSMSTSTSTTDETTSTTDDSAGGSTGDCPVGTAGCACDGELCDTGLECMSGTCQATTTCAAETDVEPNDDEASAVDIGDVDCGMVAEVNGSVATGNSDWYTYAGNDVGTCPNDVSITIVSTDDNVEIKLPVCMFFECDMGNAQVVCPSGATEETSPEGRPGCCGSGSIEYMTQSCLGAAQGDSGNIYLRVDGTTEQACVEYALGFRFF